MSLTNGNAKQPKTIKDILTDIVDSIDGIFAGFCVDTDGLLIEEVNLGGTLGKESSLILCSLVAGIQSIMVNIGYEIGSSPWISFTSESKEYKLILSAAGEIAFIGVLTDPYVDLELLKLVLGPGVDVIFQILIKSPVKPQTYTQREGITISQTEIDNLLSMDE
ncbi:MAG: roadblock/LC7 domain-containing protein [Candidatus Hodarchaeales archaeon]